MSAVKKVLIAVPAKSNFVMLKFPGFFMVNISTGTPEKNAPSNAASSVFPAVAPIPDA